MNIIRSAVFNVIFFVMLVVFCLVGPVVLLFGKKYVSLFWDKLSWSVDLITRYLGGIDYRIENGENFQETRVIYAVRHESVWETLVMIHFFRHPVFVLKKELLQIPLFGLMAKKVGCISVDRENGVRSLIEMTKQIEKCSAEGNPIVIFPEGTRVQTGAHAELKRGIAMFYSKATNYTVVPVVHNSGKFWPKHGFIKNPGTISVKFMDPIPPGLPRDEFMNRLESAFCEGIENLNRRTV